MATSSRVRDYLVPERLDALEEIHNFTFSEAERAYLVPLSETLLTPIDNQKRYLTAMALQPMQCPACKGITCQRAAADNWDLDKPASERDHTSTDSDYHCPLCYVQLIWSMDLFGGPSWFSLAPGQTIDFPIGKFDGMTKLEATKSSAAVPLTEEEYNEARMASGLEYSQRTLRQRELMARGGFAE